MRRSTLDSLLSALAVDVQAFAICEIAEGVGLVFPPVNAIEVHHVLEGTLHLSIDNGEPIQVDAGAMLIVPPGRLQHLATSVSTETSKAASDVCRPVRDGIIVLDATNGAVPTLRIACGTVLADAQGSFGPLDGLTQHVAENLADLPLIGAAFDAMLEEVAAPSEGTMALTSALMKACLVVLLRRHLRSSALAGTPPALFQDLRIGRAIVAVLDRPAVNHSVTSMAKEAGMSRSAFAREFKAHVKVTPMDFVVRVRMDLAARMLVATGDSIEAVATNVGFRSRSHFSQLFRHRYGADPSTFRRRHEGEPEP